MFRRGMRREERRDVVEVAAVGGVVHEAHKANEAEAQLAEAQAQQAEAAAAPAQAQPEAAKPAAADATPPEAAKPTAAAVTEEQVTELERLAKLKEEGILTDEEFAAEKAKILGL
jgi:Short C-terminal domain